MLKSIQVNNFKSLNFSESIDISPMSIFCGANSSGKSSFLQAILLLAQTSDTRFNGSSMLLNGKLVKLGGFNDIVSFGKENELIKLKADIEGNENSDINRVIVSLDFGFGHEVSEVQREQISPPIKNITFEIYNEKQSIPIIIDLCSTNKDGVFQVNNINRKDILIRGKDPLDFDIKEIHLDGIKPEKCIIEYNSKKLEVSRNVDFLTDIKSHKFYYRAQKDLFEKNIDKKIIESIKNIVLREQNNIRKKIKKNIEEESPHSLPSNISKELVFQMILRSQITIDANELNQLIENLHRLIFLHRF